MNPIVEHLLHHFLGGIRMKAMGQLIKIINGLRRFFVIVYFLIFSVVMAGLGLFSALGYIFFQVAHKGEMSFDAFLIFSIVDFALFAFVGFILLSKNSWQKAFGLANYFERL